MTLVSTPDDDYSADFEGDPCCEVCGNVMEWEDCDQCAGEGGFDGEELMQQDPLWYTADDYERCTQCDGKGGWWQCINARQHETDDDPGLRVAAL